MRTDIVMPRLSDSMEEGTVLSWLKSVGDEVTVGDELVEIETDKANMVFEADAAGILLEILAPEGETRPIGSAIARVGAAAMANPAPPRFRLEWPRPKASPLARRIARQSGVELAALVGSGPGGRIVKADVERALGSGSAPAGETLRPLSTETRSAPSRAQVPPSPETPKGAVEVAELSKLQQTVARRMAEAKATAPHFYLQSTSTCAGAWMPVRRSRPQTRRSFPPLTTWSSRRARSPWVSFRA